MRGRLVFAMRLHHRQEKPLFFQFAIRQANFPQHFRAGHFEINEVVGVIDETHLVRVRIRHADIMPEKPVRIHGHSLGKQAGKSTAKFGPTANLTLSGGDDKFFRKTYRMEFVIFNPPSLKKFLHIAFFLAAFAASALAGGYVEEKDGRTVIHLSVWDLPDPTDSGTAAQADIRVVNEFVRRFPRIFAERYRDKYKADPARYGKHAWDKVEIQLHRFSGISIAGTGMDSKPLMAIAGGVSPDIIYVNFRQSDTYIQQGFLYPLDKPEDNYLSSLTEEEKEFRIHPKIWPVIKREGPYKKVHVWAMPKGGLYGKVMFYRKDILDAHDIPYPKNDWTWDDLFEICRKVTSPEDGVYGILFGRGFSESWHWVTFLWSAGADAMVFDEKKNEWQAVFNTPEAVTALDFYTRLCTEPWTDKSGRKRYGYAYKEAEGGKKWELGKIAFNCTYINEKMFASINPDITGMAPVPMGPGGHRGGEINSQMQGIFSGIKDKAIRDAAWEYLRFTDSKEAVGIRTRIMVEGGLGRFVNPKYLKMFGYDDIIRMAPKGWEKCFEIAVETGKPEPYGRNCQLVYTQMTVPMTEAETMALDGELSEDKDERYQQLKGLLDDAVKETNEKMIGIVSPGEMLKRRITASVVLLMIVVVFILVFRKITKVFSAPAVAGEKAAGWGFRKYRWAYLLLVPALLTIAFWQYLPLGMGSLLAFQDYRIMGGSPWVGVDNFGSLLWDKAWWLAVWNSARYCVLVIGLTFLPPVILAVLLQEIPRGKILLRTIFYLPAVISGLVVIYLWQSFYEPTEYGVLNAVMLSIPAFGYIIIGGIFFLILFFFARRLVVHDKYLAAGMCLVVGIGMFWFFFSFARPMLMEDGVPWYVGLFKRAEEPYRWLLDPKTAMFCCVLPMVWAGMGPGCLIYLAALKGIAEDFYEAADIDGASFIDKILFVVIPILKPLLIIQFIGIFIASWQNEAYILAMTGGASGTEVAGLHIFYKAYMYLKFGPAAAMAWVLGFMLIGFTVHQLRILSRLEFKTTGNK